MCFGKRQLKMCYLRHEPKKCDLPEGYSVCNFSKESEKIEYVKCCRNGLSGDKDGTEWFDNCIIGHECCVPETDCFFIKHGEEYVAAITAIYYPTKQEGYVHMVGVRTDYRGKGLSAPLNYLAVKKLYDQGAKSITLTTDDWRVPAVKGYLKTGFIPMSNGYEPWQLADAKKRWTKLLQEIGHKEKCDLLYALGIKIKLNY